jgi:hypothetical protein
LENSWIRKFVWKKTRLGRQERRVGKKAKQDEKGERGKYDQALSQKK